jgi:hypothetical protein
LSALVSDSPAPGHEVGEAELWEHEGAVEELMAAHDVLPVRFGEVLDSDSAVAAMLTGRRREFESALERVAGACELSVRAAWPQETPAGEPRSGASYLGARADAESRVEELAHQLQSRLAPFCRASRMRRALQPNLSLAGAFLVAENMVSAFMAEIERLEGELGGASLVCTGPWPPYSFVQGDGAEP